MWNIQNLECPQNISRSPVIKAFVKTTKHTILIQPRNQPVRKEVDELRTPRYAYQIMCVDIWKTLMSGFNFPLKDVFPLHFIH